MLFFMSMPAKYKQECHKKYATGSPPTDIEMSDVCEHARTLAVAMQWTSGENSYGYVSGHGKVKNDNEEGYTSGKSNTGSNKGQPGTRKVSKQKDDSLESWGPKQPGETFIYIKADRCMDCGKKGWKDNSHPCRENKDKDVSKNE